MDRDHYQQIVDREIETAMGTMFPHGTGRTTDTHVRHWLNTVAQRAFSQGRAWALMGLMTANDVAEQFNISERRARALIEHRHERFGVGMKVGTVWLVHCDELPQVKPDERFRPGG